MSESIDRISYGDDGKLDEIVGTRGAHLERMTKNEWYLSIWHADGTETAIWFNSKDLPQMIERRDAAPSETRKP